MGQRAVLVDRSNAFLKKKRYNDYNELWPQIHALTEQIITAKAEEIERESMRDPQRGPSFKELQKQIEAVEDRQRQAGRTLLGQETDDGNFGFH